eukprot:CAMPEP_0204873932 /NCGR_PEP_ID=MMETSP1348-20121228/41937_1 /ASSEMBLY_ACC=CAM_ASM_000700 /TAXON_ID=215587 /ORGANISM="Aplanochytrium stocchinoi, Strain GSBS06" /LENGTH=383 /DNA_ID=CAMNT_0052029501 /DNA_START=371 /DNA_END=1522 /DNA_ORIENTATION=+
MKAYRIKGEIIGEGGYSNVYQGYSPEVNEKAAIKRVPIQPKEKPLILFPRTIQRSKQKKQEETNALLERFNGGTPIEDALRELEIWKQMNESTPFASSLYEFKNFKSEIWFVMELCTPLDRYLDKFESKHGFLPTMEIIKEMFAGIFLALRQIHNLGFVHRDVKVENILLTKSLTPKLTDFGFCESFKEKELNTGYSVFGTYYTAPPEAFCVNNPYNTSADMYSLCITMLSARFNGSVWCYPENRLYKLVYKGCYARLSGGKWTVEEAEDYYLKCARIVRWPQSLTLDRNSKFMTKENERLLWGYGAEPWTELRDQFSDFSKEHMRWDVNIRPTVEQACQHPYMKEVTDRWEKNQVSASIRLKQLIDDYINLDITLEEREKIF